MRFVLETGLAFAWNFLPEEAGDHGDLLVSLGL